MRVYFLSAPRIKGEYRSSLTLHQVLFRARERESERARERVRERECESERASERQREGEREREGGREEGKTKKRFYWNRDFITQR